MDGAEAQEGGIGLFREGLELVHQTLSGVLGKRHLGRVVCADGYRGGRKGVGFHGVE
jgi:hypothetical protein